MAALYLLDTNILIAALKGHPAVRARLESTPLDSLRLSTVVLGELEFGAEKSAYAERNRNRLAELTRRLPLLGLDAETAACYGRIRSHLERLGTPIGANDLWIAAQAQRHGATVVTDNLREFERVPGLGVENWLVG
ncbi:MAG TPA: type II toxin-antitoxin system VapC family toxin [Burkholderiaceae bacterium]|nr:type II toxin-antitoxin system VapC family toxin [Burkholderiaceae bacterium]HMY99471.1 type II toxin-antitoxin system VapC family toxin [Burkholderiaceae bacterium]HNB44020.1 type II toxin-antitoxin system VapC family toxin [Burkholderiaceae bacterium]